MSDLRKLVQQRHSSRVAFDPDRSVAREDLWRILDAARWAPTAHNMQNFEILVVDRKETLAAVGAIHTSISAQFLRENYDQLSFSEEELKRRKTGLLAEMFPPSWRSEGARSGEIHKHSFLGGSLQDCPLLLVVLYDSGVHAPASEHDRLGMISLGCVLQSMWLTAHSLGIGFQVLSVLAGEDVEAQVRSLLGVPRHLNIAYACRLGYPKSGNGYLRVRRELGDFVHDNRYGEKRMGGI